jgi:hypothetical protein
MPRTDRFAERIGTVFLPEANTISAEEDFTPNPEGPIPIPDIPIPIPDIPIPELPQPFPRPIPWPPDFRFCFTSLKTGCYTLSFVPNNTPIFGTRFRGTMRFERNGSDTTFSGDLYSRRLLDDIIANPPGEILAKAAFDPTAFPSDEAADTGGAIPIYPRRKYRSYLSGTRARLFSLRPKHGSCTFTLEFDEFVYNHPATGFSGSFATSPTRSVRYVFRSGAADFYTGEAYVGSTKIGTVSMRWVSPRFRRAQIQLNTLNGSVSPPADVGGMGMPEIFANAGWDVTFTDGGAIPLPASLAGVDINACWSRANLHALMQSVPGYDATDLDSTWRVHLVAVPATLGCSRGVMFDSSSGADPNGIPREGSGTFSHDGYPANEVPAPGGGSHYDGAADQQQRNVPRAFLRSATHEVGHAFNQIHQGFEGGSDNSIMSPTPSVAQVLGTTGTFPDDINLAFNATVTKHLRHLPDPAVRPGAMDFFGSAISAPEAADVAWLDTAELAVELSSDQVHLGEPVTLRFTLTNAGETAIPAPEALDTESLLIRINVTDPTGQITFMRPPEIESCPHITLQPLEPRESVSGETTLYWGSDGFAFGMPGRHVVQVIALWNVAGVPVGAEAEQAIFVSYPTTENDNTTAALMLDPDVGKAVATGNVAAFPRADERIRQVMELGERRPVAAAIRRMGLTGQKPRQRGGRRTKSE